MRASVSSVGIILAAALAVGCGSLTQGRDQAQKKVREFHALFNDKRFDEIYDTASDEFHGASTRADFTALLSAVHRKLGKAVATKNNGWRVNTFNLVTSVNLVQNTEFENGRGVETFVLVLRGGSPVLVGYHINSNDLIIR